jgi:hypothetical protein
MNQKGVLLNQRIAAVLVYNAVMHQAEYPAFQASA